MTTPKIIDDDNGTITAETPMRVVRSWSYGDRAEQRQKMRMAREFAEGMLCAGQMHQAVKLCDQRKALLHDARGSGGASDAD